MLGDGFLLVSFLFSSCFSFDSCASIGWLFLIICYCILTKEIIGLVTKMGIIYLQVSLNNQAQACSFLVFPFQITCLFWNAGVINMLVSKDLRFRWNFVYKWLSIADLSLIAFLNNFYSFKMPLQDLMVAWSWLIPWKAL